MDFKKGHAGDTLYFQIDIPYDVCTGKDVSKNRVVEMHNHLKSLDKKVLFSYKSWGMEKQADYFYIQEVQVNKCQYFASIYLFFYSLLCVCSKH